MDAILKLSITTNCNNLQHIHREAGTKQRLVLKIALWHLKLLWLAAACKLLELGIYINKGFPVGRPACSVSLVLLISSF